MNRKHYLQRTIYILCAVFLCLTDQRVGSAYYDISSVFVYLSWIFLGSIVLSAYKLEDFLAPVYGLWLVLCMIGIPILAAVVHEDIYFTTEWFCRMLFYAFYGMIWIRTLQSLLLDRQKPHTPLWFFGTYMLLLILMWISKSDLTWPAEYLIMFGPFLLAPFGSQQKQDIISCFETGFIISYLLFFEYSLIFRPYDELRYLGVYSNANINALFYSLVYCAFLSKFCRIYLSDRKKNRLFKEIMLLLGCGSVWVFLLFTMCRSAMLSMLVITAVAGIYCMIFSESKPILRGLSLCGALLLCIVICFPILYTTVRYVPAVIHKPINFYYEHRDDSFKITYMDPVDSPKYTDWREILENNFNRVFRLLHLSDTSESTESLDEYSLIRPGSPVILASKELRGSQIAELKAEKLLPDSASSTQIRLFVYKHFLSEIGLSGHLSTESWLQVTSSYEAPHAHNIFLQYSFDFGIVSGILFLLSALYLIISSLRSCFGANQKEQREFGLSLSLLFLNVIVFSLFEYGWGRGMLSITCLYLFATFVPCTTFSSRQHTGLPFYRQ